MPAPYDIRFSIGLGLVITGFVICMLPYLFIVGVPVFIVGVISIWYSKTRMPAKIWSTILPIVFWYPTIYLFYTLLTNHVTPATYLIPEGFRGKIQIYYGEPCGIEIQKKNGRNIFPIPKDGILFVSNPLETGTIDNEYYFVNSKGLPKTKIETLIQQDFNGDYTLEKNEHEPSRKKVGLFFGGTGTDGMEHGRSIRFEFFYVLAWDSLRVYNERPIDSVAEMRLKECRK